MDKLAKKILEYCEKSGKTTDCFVSLDSEWDMENQIKFKDFIDTIGASEADIKAAVSYLEKMGLVEYRYLKGKTTTIKIAFHLTHEGLHYREIKALKSREKWKERAIGFISGVFVSVVSGLILAWLR